MNKTATIYHNARCGTSRTVLSILEQHGYRITVIDYLKNPPSASTLLTLIDDAGRNVRDAIRSKEALYSELGLDNPALSDDALVKAMIDHPILINRPIVVTDKGTRLCRPAEIVYEIIDKS